MLRRRRAIEVPDVVGFGASEACAIVEAAGLVPCGPERLPAPTTGVISAQEPACGTNAEPGSPVMLWTRGGPGAEDLVGPPPLEPAVPV